MIEPTESETKEGLDAFAQAISDIVNEEETILKGAPWDAAVRRVDEVSAARKPILSWGMMGRK